MKTFLLIDNHALLYRFFHALPPLTTPDGRPAGAIYGLARVLLKILKEQKPDYWVAAFDMPDKTFRGDLYEKYKIHRPAQPEDLRPQMAEARLLYEQFGIKTLGQAGFEADDLIGSLSEKFKDFPNQVIIILSGDLDVLQLVDDRKVVVQFIRKGISDTFIYDEKEVFNRYGLKPEQLPDLKGLLGDPSDNIPGIKGVGIKTAAPLIQQHGSLENLFENLWQIPDKIGNKLESQKEIAFLSKKLAIIKKDLSLDYQLEDFARKPLNKNEVGKYFKELGFESLVQKI